jgi:hypothetical protein
MEKNIVFIINSNEFSQKIVENFINEKFKIILLVDDLDYFKDQFFDIWDKFENILTFENIKNLEKYENLYLVSLINLNDDGANLKSLQLISLLKSLHYKKLIFVNQFLNEKSKRNNLAYNNIYESYLNELAIVNLLTNFHILRIGQIGNSIINTPFEYLLSEIKRILISDKPVPQFPYLTSFILKCKTKPLLGNINFNYCDIQVKKDDLYIQYSKFHKINEIHKVGKGLILTGLFFKATSLILQKFLKI